MGQPGLFKAAVTDSVILALALIVEKIEHSPNFCFNLPCWYLKINLDFELYFLSGGFSFSKVQ